MLWSMPSIDSDWVIVAGVELANDLVTVIVSPISSAASVVFWALVNTLKFVLMLLKRGNGIGSNK